MTVSIFVSHAQLSGVACGWWACFSSELDAVLVVDGRFGEVACGLGGYIWVCFEEMACVFHRRLLVFLI